MGMGRLRGDYLGVGVRQREGLCSTGNGEEPEAAPQVPQPQRLKPTSWDRPQTAPRPLPDRYRTAWLAAKHPFKFEFRAAGLFGDGWR